MVGPGGFMLFRTSDHGALLRLAGQKKKAVQYLLGNPLFAIQMTQHDIRAGLYAPLRVLLYEDERGKTSGLARTLGNLGRLAPWLSASYTGLGRFFLDPTWRTKDVHYSACALG